MTSHYLLCASADHVAAGVAGGFAQAGHGRQAPVAKLKKGDWIVYYSSKDRYEGGAALQAFTAIGQVVDEAEHQASQTPTFKPYRRSVRYVTATSASIRPLLPLLSFIKNKQRWGFYLMGSFRKISDADFAAVAKAMNASAG